MPESLDVPEGTMSTGNTEAVNSIPKIAVQQNTFWACFLCNGHLFF
ncbi:MAG: hypothetical protein GF311_27480 [Candidatus Lokiarchaeota archaeon]|nr:hypothetical protein [Candidatus Lokiarchaeota archaeon]